jgi:TM2 domain-containing membrane protein YozV
MLEALQLRKDEVARREEELRVEVRELPADQRKIFFTRQSKEYKDPDTYAVTNYFFFAGIHHFYLGKFLRGLTDLVLVIVGLLLLFSDYTALGIIILVFVLGLEMMALFRSEIIVNDYNNQISAKILAEVRAANTWSTILIPIIFAMVRCQM